MVTYGVKCFFGALPRMIPFEKRQVNLSAIKKMTKSSIKLINVQFNVQRNPAAYRTNRCIMFDVTVSKGFSCILVSGCKFMKSCAKKSVLLETSYLFLAKGKQYLSTFVGAHQQHCFAGRCVLGDLRFMI